jgi:phenylalanyl-tRNA synthetase beta chain
VEPPSRHPATERDLAVVVDADVAAATVERAIRGAAGPELVALRLFDVYRGVPLAANEKSLAWRLVLQSRDRTLTDADIDPITAAITESLGAIGGRIRT